MDSKLPGNGTEVLPLQPLLQNLRPDLPHTPALRPSLTLREPAERRQPPRTTVTARRGTAAAGTGRWPRESACLTVLPTPPPQRRRVGTRHRYRRAPVPFTLPAAGGPRDRRHRRPLFPWQQYTPWPPGRGRSAADPSSAPGPGGTLTHLRRGRRQPHHGAGTVTPRALPSAAPAEVGVGEPGDAKAPARAPASACAARPRPGRAEGSGSGLRGAVTGPRRL